MLVRTLLVLVSLSLLGCDDNPTKPKPDPKTYSFYGLDVTTSRRALRLDPATCDLDTITSSLPRSNGFIVSADGQHLYVPAGDSLAIFSTDSGTLVRSLYYHANHAAASPNGRYLSIMGASYLGLGIVELPGYTERYHDATLNAESGVFSFDSNTLYCIDATQPAREVLRVRVGPTVTLERKAVPQMPGGLILVAPSVDEKLWFLYSRLDAFVCYFGVYDVAGDSLRLLIQLIPGGGWIAVSADGQSVFFTNPGTLLIGPIPPPSAFYRYDIPTNTVTEVSTEGLAGDPELDYMPVGPLAISPDGKTLVLARAVDGNDLVVYDVPSRAISNYCNFDYQALFFDINCQPGR